MRNRLVIYIFLLTAFFNISCSLTRDLAFFQQDPRGPEAPSQEVASINEEIPEPAIPLLETENEIIENYSCPEYLDCSNEQVQAVNDEGIDSVTSIKEEESVLPAAREDESLKEEPEESGQDLLDSALDFVNASQEFWSEGNLDEAIVALDQAYTSVLKVDIESNPELIQQKEDLRFMISKRILEIYASRYTAVNGNHNEIPLTMNTHVEKEIKRFQGPERRFFIESYKRSGKYMDKILVSLKEAGLPEELAWLPLIESGFKVRALSRARALGLWQFIPSTGYKFGLKRDTWIDERLDPEKATAAAIAYLKELHQIFGDWTTVLAGYNCGEGRVMRKIRNQKINYLDNFWDLYKQLPRETARYVPRFLATLHILKDPAKYGFELEESDSPVAYETVTVSKPMQLKAIARKLGFSSKELAGLNAELRQKATPPTPYALKIPAEKRNVFLAHLDQIPRWSPPKSSYVMHRVRSGETLSIIALRYRTTVRKIVRANNIRRKHFIKVGKKLKIPLRGTSAGQRYASSKSTAKLMPGGNYKVRKGDSLWLIAKKFNTNTKKLQKINELRTTRLSVGQVLKVVD